MKNVNYKKKKLKSTRLTCPTWNSGHVTKLTTYSSQNKSWNLISNKSNVEVWNSRKKHIFRKENKPG